MVWWTIAILGYLTVIVLAVLVMARCGFDFRGNEPLGQTLLALWPVGLPILSVIYLCIQGKELGERWRVAAEEKRARRLERKAAESNERLRLQNEAAAHEEESADIDFSLSRRRGRYR